MLVAGVILSGPASGGEFDRLYTQLPAEIGGENPWPRVRPTTQVVGTPVRAAYSRTESYSTYAPSVRSLEVNTSPLIRHPVIGRRYRRFVRCRTPMRYSVASDRPSNSGDKRPPKTPWTRTDRIRRESRSNLPPLTTEDFSFDATSTPCVVTEPEVQLFPIFSLSTWN